MAVCVLGGGDKYRDAGRELGNISDHAPNIRARSYFCETFYYQQCEGCV
jgi:hypothetical protein